MSAWADTSEKIDLLSAAWVKAYGQMSDIQKKRTANAGQYSYSYADLSDTLEMARPVLSSNGLAVTQSAESTDLEVLVWTTILHESGQYVTTVPLRLPAGKTAQNTGSSISYARRYALMAVLGLATEDDDGASADPRPTGRARLGEKALNGPRGETPRTAEEARIRRILAGVPASDAKGIRAEFTERFGTTLADLPTDKHREALAFIEDRVNGQDTPTGEDHEE